MSSGRKAVFGSILITVLVLGIGLSTPALCAEDCIKFSPDKAEVKQINGRWKVVQGDMWMLDFDQSEAEAQKALSIIQHYKLDSQCYVGRPGPSMEYWLVGGKSPAGSFEGEDAVPFNPDTTEAKLVNGSWKVVDGDHWLLDFGDNEGEAQASLKLIKKYGFNHICFVGRPDPGMTYFRKDKMLVPMPGGLERTPIKPLIREDCIKFDPNLVEAKRVDGRWKVVQGDMWMLDFDQSQTEAQKAAKIIKHYNMDSQCYVGRPGPSMEYWLVGGRPPIGKVSGEDAVAFNPSTVEAKMVNGSWKVVDGDHWILDFADNEAEAQTALGLIKKYEFDHICFVGRPDPGMTYFRRDGTPLTPGTVPPGPGRPQPLRITASLTADPANYTGAYPVTVRFKGNITASGPCIVTYTFSRSDDAIGPTYKMKFARAGSKRVSDTWTLSKDCSGWEQVKIISPVETRSNQAEFTLKQLSILNHKSIKTLP